MPLLEDEPGATGRTFAFSEYSENEEAMIRSDRYKLIVGNGRKARRDGYASGAPAPGPYERFHDLENDPDELIDLSGVPEHAQRLAAYRHALFQRLTATRKGQAQVPPGLSEREAIAWSLVPRDRPRDR